MWRLTPGVPASPLLPHSSSSLFGTFSSAFIGFRSNAPEEQQYCGHGRPTDTHTSRDPYWHLRRRICVQALVILGKL
jgi:hypothetical protein